MSIEIRPATPEDLAQVQEIFEHYVLNTVVSFLVQKPPSGYIESRYRISVERNLPYLAAVESGTEKVVGFTYASAFRGFMLGYGHSVEMSLFCAPGYSNQGIGSKMMVALLDALRQTRHVSHEDGHEENKVEFEIKKVFAIMAIDEAAPKNGLALRDWYLKFGFEEVGRLKGVGNKKDRM